MLQIEDIYEIHEKYSDALKVKVEEFTLGNKSFHFNSEKAILGVINLSKDSRYRESICVSTEKAIRRGIVLNAQGADIVDIGAESVGENTERVGEIKQQNQLLPVVEALSQKGILTSIETYYPQVARECLQAGANVINLTSGSADSEKIYQIVSEFDAGVIICYIQGKHAREVANFTFGDDPVDLMYDYFGKEIEKATKLGVRKIFIDTGIGFDYKNLQDTSLRIRYEIKTILNAFRLRKLGFPICQVLSHAFECFGDEFRTGQAIFAVLAAFGKVDLMRTHEVAKVKGVLETLSLF